MSTQGVDRWARYRRALAGEALPAALVDLDALDTNSERLRAPIRAANKRVRLASKSLRCTAAYRACGRSGMPCTGNSATTLSAL